ncbi:MAG: hypothetical protein CM15mP120_00500 [Pseudomonadota bacterium]|nr:MAG: hypothetical protein CM15mP120_00500 [Pseudomonadota bacterium]
MIQSHDTAHWLALLGQHDIPCAQVNDLKDLVDDRSCSLVDGCKTTAIRTRRLSVAGSTFRIRGETAAESTRAPKIGEHSVAVLTQLGYDNVQVQGFIDSGVVGV